MSRLFTISLLSLCFNEDYHRRHSLNEDQKCLISIFYQISSDYKFRSLCFDFSSLRTELKGVGSCKMDISMIELVLIVTVILGIYKYLTRNDDIFKKREVSYEKPVFLFGNLWENLTGRINGIELFQKYYEMFKDEQ